MKVESRVKWVRHLMTGLEMFGWRGVNTEALSRLSINEVKQVLKDISWSACGTCFM